ncbi:helix-turn-helix transcriptional regulator [Nonomuraea sp. NPDC046570]|uniref:helix-turn-helix domain-containing protein n=1 Tax=Nonomuraea sp. NPDC046570 TaxID=3155255 RepID=UPI0033ED5EB5
MSKFRAVFEQSGISKRALARRIGFDGATPVYGYLSGKRRPKPPTVERMAEILGCKAEDLYVEVEL